MTKYERIAIIIGVVALLLSFLSPIVSTWLSYRYFDPAQKQYADRGIFIFEEINLPSGIFLEEDKPPSRIDASFILKNLGPSPIDSPQLVAVLREGSWNDSNAEFTNETSNEIVEGNILSKSMNGSIAAGANLKIEINGIFSSVILRTQYGDVYRIFQWNESSRRLDIGAIDNTDIPELMKLFTERNISFDKE